MNFKVRNNGFLERLAEEKLFDSFDDKKGHLPLIGQYLVLLAGWRKILPFLLVLLGDETIRSINQEVKDPVGLLSTTF